MGLPPWIYPFLQKVKEEYKHALPPASSTPPTEEDKAWIEKNALEEDPYDFLNLKENMFNEYKNNTATLQKQTCALGTILAISKEPIPPKTWTTWWHCIRLVIPKKEVRIVFYLHPQTRQLPAKGLPIEPQHINGGMTMPCDSKTVIIYRKEEATRVLLHELFHASCTDPYEKPQPFIEADCETWAEIALCALKAKGDVRQFEQLITEQIVYATNQSRYLTLFHGVKTPEDYAWRYTKGRLNVFEELGFTMPFAPRKAKKPETLRLTLCEPGS